MKITVLDGFAANPGDISWDGLEHLGDVSIYERTAREDVARRIGDSDAVLTNKVAITREIIAACPNLRYIGVLATGYNIVDLEAATERGICVTNIPGYSTDSVAQMVFAHILEATLRVGSHNRAVKEGQWAASQDFCFWNYPLTELKGKTLGIIGLGSIGRAVAKIALAFQMRVMGTSRTEKQVEGVEYVSLDRLLSHADIISLHCPLTEETAGIICEKNILKMKNGVMLVNTGRGQLVSEEDILKYLDNGRIRCYMADVLAEEPPAQDNRLVQHPHAIITPHIAWATLEARRRLMDIAVENLEAWLEGRHKNCVNGFPF